jgi:hypothetical protein
MPFVGPPKTQVGITRPEEVLLTRVTRGTIRHARMRLALWGREARKQQRERIRQTLVSAGVEQEHALLYL